MKRLGAFVALLALAGCGGNDSPLVQTRIVKPRPDETYAMLDSAMRLLEGAHATGDMTVRHSSDGGHVVTVTYSKDGHAVFVQKLKVAPAKDGVQTALTQEVAPAAQATADDRRLFASMRSDLAARFDRLGSALNSKAMGEIVAAGRSEERSIMAQGTVGRASGGAQLMSTEPVLDTTPRGLAPS